MTINEMKDKEYMDKVAEIGGLRDSIDKAVLDRDYMKANNLQSYMNKQITLWNEWNEDRQIRY